MGMDRRNLRCKWTIEGRRYSEAQSLLADLAARPPSEVTTDRLVTIAGLCLCDEYHLNQQHEVAKRWADVVRGAVDHYSKAKGGSSFKTDMLSTQVTSLKLELWLAKDTKTKLENALATAQTEATNLNHKYQELQADAVKLETANVELLERLKADKIEAELQATTLKQQINQTREEIKDGKVHLEEVLTSNEKAEIENQRLQSEVDLRDEKLEQLCVDNDLLRSNKEKSSSEQASLTGQVRRLEISLSTVLAEKQDLAAKLDAKIHDLKQSETDVKRGQIAISGCEAQIATLLKRNEELEQNIASCSLHSYGIRINTLKKKLRRSSK